MTIEKGGSSDRRKNPWAVGDTNGAVAQAVNTMSHTEVTRTPEQRTRFFEMLRDGGGTLEESYSMTPLGSIDKVISRTFTGGSEGASAPVSLLSFAALGRENKWTPDSAREAALWINDLFPEVEFTFFEDRNAHTFTYRARVPSSGAQE